MATSQEFAEKIEDYLDGLLELNPSENQLGAVIFENSSAEIVFQTILKKYSNSITLIEEDEFKSAALQIKNQLAAGKIPAISQKDNFSPQIQNFLKNFGSTPTQNGRPSKIILLLTDEQYKNLEAGEALTSVCRL